MKAVKTGGAGVLICALWAVLLAGGGAQALTVVGFGDSITAGWPYRQTDGNGCRCGGYIPHLEWRLNNDGVPAVVRNYGVPGEHTADGLNRFDAVIVSSRADMVLILEGTNDLYWFSTSTVLSNLWAMVRIARARGVTPVLSTLTPDYRVYDGPLGSKVKPIGAMNSRIYRQVQNQNVALCDQFAALNPNWASWNSDGLHPNTTGYQVMASAWAPVVEDPSLYFLPATPDISVSPASIDFGEIVTGHAVDQVLSVYNRGNATLALGTVGGLDPLYPPYSLVQDGCSNSYLAARATCTLTIRFKPERSGSFQDGLNIHSTDPDTPNVQVPVQGTGRLGGVPWNILLQR